MAEVALVWCSLKSDGVTASRAQVKQWATELHLVTGRITRSNVLHAFRRAAEMPAITFTRNQTPWFLHAVQTENTSEVKAYEVRGSPVGAKAALKFIEVKLFTERRTARGLVHDSHRLKTRVRRELSTDERVAVNDWLAQFAHAYQDGQGAARSLGVRHIIRESLLAAHAIPVSRFSKSGMYFVYVDKADEMELVHRVGVFATRVAPSAQMFVLPIEAGPLQHAPFAEAADEHLVVQADKLSAKIADWQHHPGQLSLRGALTLWQQELTQLHEQRQTHERRLGHPLPSAQLRLAEVEAVVVEMNPARNLLSVTRG